MTRIQLPPFFSRAVRLFPLLAAVMVGALAPVAASDPDDEGAWFTERLWLETDGARASEALAEGIVLEPVSDPSNTTSAAIWSDYLVAPDDHPHVPNNSYAGYHRGERPIPEVPAVTDVTLHGGVGDGLTDNSDAFREAIEAAYLAGGGAVYIPPGTYRIEETVWLWRSGVVLRGAGQGQTILEFANPLLDIIGEEAYGTNIWSWSGGLLWMGPRDEVSFSDGADAMHRLDTRNSEQGYDSASNPWEYWRLGPELAAVTGEHERGERVIEVDDAGLLAPGMLVLMTWENNADQGLWEEITQHPSFQSWPDERFGSWFTAESFPRWQWTVEIAAVDGNTVTLRQPLRVATRPEYDVRILYQDPEKDYIEEAGVEDLTISLDGVPDGSPYDDGWNGVYLNRTYNCWVRNVEVVNGNNGFHVSAAKNCSLIDTTVRGDRWTHHPYTNRCMSHDVLYDGFTIDITEDSKGGTHGLNTEWFSTGNVYSRGVMNRGTFDTHRAMSFDMIRTEIALRNEANSNPGGSDKAGPYAARRMVHWNVEVSGSDRTPDASGPWAGLPNTGLYVYQPDAHTFGALVGIKGTPVCEIPTWSSSTCSVMPCGDKDVLIADHNQTPAIVNLYDAQVNERRSREPWIHLTEPGSGIVAPGGVVTLAASANAGPESIASVTFYVDGTPVAVDTAAPYEASWTPPGRGLYEVTAVMEDGAGQTHPMASPRWLTVGERLFLNHNHPALEYAGPWFEETNDAYFKGNARYVQNIGSSVELIFRGTRIQFYSTGELGHKVHFTVYLDDMETPLLSRNIRGKAGYRDLSWDSGLLEDRPHRVRIVSEQRLVVDGLMIDSTSDTVQLVAPVAEFTADPPNGLPPLEVDFDGSASYDPDGTVVEYRWDFGDGSPIFSSPTPLAGHSYAEEGEYTAVLTVVDDDGVMDSSSLPIFVGNLPPVAAFSASPESGNPPLEVTFDGSASSDADGSIVAWEWDFDDDGTIDATGSPVTGTFTEAGIHVIRLTVTDNLGGTDSTSGQITVDGLFAPVILAQPQDYATYSGFDAFFEVEPGGNPEPLLQWYRDGQPISGANLPVLELRNVDTDDDGAGFYLVATNSEGSIQSDTAVLSVEPAPDGMSVKVVDWGGDYVGATRDWQRLEGGMRGEGIVGEFGDDGLDDDKVKRLPFSDTLEVNPPVGSDYDGTNARFFGGGEVWRIDTTEKVLWRYAQVRENGIDDELYFGMTNSSINRDFLSLLWAKEDFLNLSLSRVIFNETSRLYANVTESNGGFPRVRFLVRNGGQYYISDAHQDGVGEFELTASTLRDTFWAPYDPLASIQPVPGETATQADKLDYTVASEEFDDLTAFGFFCERHSFPAAGNNNMAVADFEVFAAPAGSGGFNQAPEVAISSPTEGAVYTEPAEIPVSVSASDPDGSIAMVDVFVNGTLTEQLTVAPYAVDLTGLAAGSYAIQVVAEDDDGARTSSSLVSVSVQVPAMTVVAASWLGGAGADSVNAARVQSDGTIVLAGTAALPGTSTAVPYLLDGADATSGGVILRLSPDGQRVYSMTRLPAAVTDMAIDSADRIYIASPTAGLYVLNPTASLVQLKRLDGQFVYRVDASPGGFFAGMIPTNTSNPDTSPGSVDISLYNASGDLLCETAGPTQNTLDLCIDEVSETLITIGWRQTSASAEDNTNVLPVQIAAMRGVDFSGVEKWTNYNWQSGPWDPANPDHLNVHTNNMADSRGLLCTIGDDGLLYAGFEVAGGNHIFRWDPRDLSLAVNIVGGDMWHNFSATASEHKSFVGRYYPATGDYLLGQQFTSRYWDGTQDRGNALRLTGGDLFADAAGRVYLTGASASGLPMEPVHNYTPDPMEITFNPLPDPVYTGGAYLLMMESDFSLRRFLTRLGGGKGRAVHARVIEGETQPLIVYGGMVESINANWNGIDTNVGGQDPADPRMLLYTLEPLQPVYGGGGQDGFFALVETRDPQAPALKSGPANLTVAEGTEVTLSVSVEANPAATFQWRKNGVDLPFEVASALAFTATAADDGALYSCVMTNPSGSVETTGALLTIASDPQSYAAWIDGFYPGSADPLVIGQEGDPERDGISNLLEYLLGLEPDHPDAGTGPSLFTDGGELKVSYPVSAKADGVFHWLEWSSDLENWHSDMGIPLVPGTRQPDYRMLEGTLPAEGRQFIRIQVELP